MTLTTSAKSFTFLGHSFTISPLPSPIYTLSTQPLHPLSLPQHDPYSGGRGEAVQNLLPAASPLHKMAIFQIYNLFRASFKNLGKIIILSSIQTYRYFLLLTSFLSFSPTNVHSKKCNIKGRLIQLHNIKSKI